VIDELGLAAHGLDYLRSAADRHVLSIEALFTP
jgi:hypothetical protein